MTTVNRFVNDCTNLNFLISTLEIALANIPRDVLVLLSVADVHECSKVDFPYLIFLCAFFVTSFYPFSIVAFSSGIHTVRKVTVTLLIVF